MIMMMMSDDDNNNNDDDDDNNDIDDDDDNDNDDGFTFLFLWSIRVCGAGFLFREKELIWFIFVNWCIKQAMWLRRWSSSSELGPLDNAHF